MMRWTRDRFVLTDEHHATLVDDTFRLLAATYWGHKRPREVVEKMVRSSHCFVLLVDEAQVGFARVITDYATTSWLADVVIGTAHQGSGVGTWMMQCILEHPMLCETQFALQTGDAQEFYQRLGFATNKALMSTPIDYLASDT